MTAGSPDLGPARAPILVLGLGNLLLGDDGAGLSLLDLVSADPDSSVEFVDGGTQGLALLGVLDRRQALLILDAVGFGEPPGTVHVVRKEKFDTLRAHRQGSAHEGNALELLEAARLLGTEPGEVVVVGIEPQNVRTGIGLSHAVATALPAAVEAARTVLRELQSKVQ